MWKYYFDYAATTPLDKRVIKAMEPYCADVFGNPSSIHKFGQEASAAVFKARNKIAKLIGCDYREIIFTGSATEANNLAIRGIIKNIFENGEWKQKKLPQIITSQIEHESVLETCRDLEKEGLAEIVYLPVSKNGIVDLKKLKTALNERTVLVSIMYANNEIGSIQPIKKIAEIIANFKIEKKSFYPLFHTDAAQAFNYLNCDVKELGIDMMTLSSQKIYGPKGVGLLYIKDFGNFQGKRFISPIITGGGQEEGLRSGTENIAGMVGFAEAGQIVFDSKEKESKRLLQIQNYFLKKLKSISGRADFVLNGPEIGENRLPNNINIYFKGKKDLIFKLDMAGFAVSGGSACSARLAKPSHVLKAIGCSDEKASESIRISFGRQTTRRIVEKLLLAFKKIIKSQQDFLLKERNF
jgi:cysteine desulfurase